MGIFDLSSIRKTVQSLGSELKAMRDEIETLKREREQIMAAPTARSDMKAAIKSWVNRSWGTYLKAFSNEVDTLVKQPQKVADIHVFDRIMRAVSVTGRRDAIASPDSVDLAITALFGSTMTEALHRAVDAMDWPAEGLAYADRLKAVEKIDRRIAELESKVEEMVSSARGAGIHLPPA